MAKNIHQIFISNPITTNTSTDLMYFGQSPYTSGANDAAMTFANFSAQFVTNVLTTKGDLITYSTAPTRLAVGGSNGEILQVNSSTTTGLSWSTATYPPTTTINQLLYSSSNNTITGLPTANNATLQTNSSGVPSWVPISSNTTIYVSSTIGNDTTGNGSIDRPYKTIAFAMSSITTNTINNVFTIFLLDGNYTETVQIKLKAFVNIFSPTAGTIITSSLPMILDTTSWGGSDSGFAYYTNLEYSNDINIDITTTSATQAPFVQFNNVIFIGQFHFNGGDVNAPNGFGSVVLVGCEFYNDAFIDNANGGLSQTNIYFGNLNFATIDHANFINFDQYSDNVQGSIIIGGGSPGGFQFYSLTGCNVNAITINGSNARLTSDVSSYVTPTVTGTPTIVIRNISDSLTANFTPSNYTPTATAPTLTTSVRAHLQGIDADLANFNVGNKSIGTTTNNNASAGHVGEYITNSATGVSVSNGNAFNATTISLTAGDWEVSGVIGFIAAGSTVPTLYQVGINTTSLTIPSFPSENNLQQFVATFGAGASNYINVGPTRISLASTTTIYLIGVSNFTVSTMTASGFLKARRVR